MAACFGFSLGVGGFLAGVLLLVWSELAGKYDYVASDEIEEEKNRYENCFWAVFDSGIFIGIFAERLFVGLVGNLTNRWVRCGIFRERRGGAGR